MEEIKNIHPKGLENLIHGIIKNAVIEYQTAITKDDTRTQKEIERFFHSDWFKSMTSVDGEYIMKKAVETIGKKHLNRKHMVKQKKKKKKCDKV